MSKNLRSISARSRLLFSRSPLPWAPISRSRSFSAEPSQIETLAYEEVLANPDRPYSCTAFVLHGLMGAARNWRTFSRRLAAELHKLHPDDEQLWVLDSVPGEIKTDFTGGEVEQILQVLQNLPSSFPSRKLVVEHFLGLGYSKAIADWIGSNLKKEGDSYVWVFDLQATIDMFNSYWSTSYWPIVEHPPKDMEIAIVQGENSDRWTEDAIQRVRSLSKKEWGPDEGRVTFHVLPKAGHWVHVDNPKGLLDIMVPNFYSKGG